MTSQQRILIEQATALICDAMVQQNVNRQELARRLGRSNAYVSQVLSGHRNMTLKTLAAMAAALDMDVVMSLDARPATHPPVTLAGA